MSSDATLNQIMHYQKKLEKYAAVGETEKILCCIHKLKYLPVTVAHLEITGVGKSINNLRNRKDIIGDKAQALVKKWKSMVKEEERLEYLEKEKSKQYTENNSQQANEDEYDPSDEGDRLQIQEENIVEEPVETVYNPTKTYCENEEENSDSYNPRTSREDYLLAGVGSSHHSYSPSSRAEYNKHTGESSVQNGNSSSMKEDKADHYVSEENKHKKKHRIKSEHSRKEKVKSEESNSTSYKRDKDKYSKGKDVKRSKSLNHKDDSKSHSSENKSLEVSQNDVMDVSFDRSNDHHEFRVCEPVLPVEDEIEENPINHVHEKVSKKRSDEKREKKRKEKDRKNKRLKESHHKSSKRLKVETPEMDNGFGAALMGIDNSSSVKKKKKKKSKDREPKEHQSSNSSNKIFSRSDQIGKPPLPELPASFEDEIKSPSPPQLMTHYKPLPYVPSRDSIKDRFPKQMTNEEALNYMLSSKNNKQRRIYAGKTTGMLSVPSLFDMCIRVLQENIDALEVTGGIPFDLLRPVLEKASHHQLLSLENYNPYLLEDTDVLWAAHCRKSFKNKSREDMETWRDMFLRCTDEHREKMRFVTKNIQEKHITKAPPKRKTQLAFINTTAKPPKSVARAQAKYGTGSVSSSSVAKSSSRADEDQKRSSSSSSSSVPSALLKPDRPPQQSKPTAGKKPKVAPLMGKARQLMKKVCRR